jgi:short-subunit dehydrogenase
MNEVSKSVALITGASSGIGAIYADRLARRGHHLILVARNQERLETVARQVTASTGRKVAILVADLADPAGVAKVEEVLRTNPDLTMLVNNAGVGATAPLLKADVGKMSQMIALNTDVLMRLTYAAAPAFVARGVGTIINIASIAAVGPEILNGVYGGSKAFVLAFSQSLKHELTDKGVCVQVVLPGATATDFWDAAGTPVSYLPPEIVMNAEAMVDAALVGLDQGEFVTLPSLPEVADWQAYESARQALFPNLSRSSPAGRYGIAPGGEPMPGTRTCVRGSTL